MNPTNPSDPLVTALLELLSKGGATFGGAAAALGIIWHYAVRPLLNRLLDMHGDMAKGVTDALKEHSAALRSIGERMSRIEGKFEEYLEDHRR